MNNPWQTGKPPHLEWVEVEMPEDQTGKILGLIRVRAVWGDQDQGRLPHWEGDDGTLYSPDSFKRWRHVLYDWKAAVRHAKGKFSGGER